MERMSSWGSALSRLSVSQKVEDDGENECVSAAGDIGDRALNGGTGRHSESGGGFRLSLDITPENGAVYKPVDHELQQYPAPLNNTSAVNPSEQLPTPVSTNGKVNSEDTKQVYDGDLGRDILVVDVVATVVEAALAVRLYLTAILSIIKDCDMTITVQELDKKLPKLLNYVSCLTHLAVFGILGVLTRYLLQKLFGPGVVGVTSDQTILYLDLPSNMVGSFFMGWFGVVFKGDISRVSEHLAIALTTGYLGSLTTFSGWNQKMLELSVAGHWLWSVLGFLIGLFLVAFSIIFGIETAKGFKWLLIKLNKRPGSGYFISKVNWKVDNFLRQLVVTIMLLMILALLWGVSGVLEKNEFKHGGDAARLWFASIIGPLGVWLRWFLARLNGRGIGGGLKWLPIGTLIANVSAACVMAALATVKKSVNTTNCDTIVSGGLQFGLLGCLSTVSTFAAEFNAMRESMHPWRAYAYAGITICVSFTFGILIYCIPVSRM